MELGESNVKSIPDLWTYGWDSRINSMCLRQFHQHPQMHLSSGSLRCLFHDGNGGILVKTFKV
ncbi:hypothetical protein [Candidatus Nitrosocosmicus sp. T]